MADEEKEMTMHKMKLLLSAGAAMLSLVACGGGGGGSSGSSPVVTPTTLSFALATGYAARIANGATNNFDISGSCTGTATISTAAAVAATFEGVTGYSAAQTSTVNFAANSCTPQTNTVTGTTYYNTGYVTIGQSINGGEYAKFETPPSAFPSSVKVGDTGDVSTLITYQDSTKAVVTGKRVLSYAIENDTATTSIANIITKTYDTGDHLLSTQQSRYHMAEDGTLTLASIDIQFSFTSTIHLVYTAK
jgi:hypothetical protein